MLLINCLNVLQGTLNWLLNGFNLILIPLNDPGKQIRPLRFLLILKDVVLCICVFCLPFIVFGSVCVHATSRYCLPSAFTSVSSARRYVTDVI